MEQQRDAPPTQDQSPEEQLTEMTTLRDEAVAHWHDLEALLAAVTDPMVVCDIHSHIVRANPAFHALLNTFSPSPHAATLQERADALTMRDVHGEVLLLQDQPQERMLGGEVITEGDPTLVMTRALNGVECVYSVTGGPLYHGDDIIGTVAFFRDISTQQRLQGNLRESRDESAAIFDALTDPLFVYNVDGQLIRTNHAARWLFPPDDAEDSPLHVSERAFSYHVRDVHGRPLPPEQWPLARLLRGETLGGEDEAPVRVQLPDGREVMLTYTGAPIRAEGEEITGYVALGRDVTQQYGAEEALRQAHKDLEQRVSERTYELATTNAELRRLSRQVLDIQERERRAIAQELHDEIGQELTGANMMLDSLDKQLRALVKDATYQTTNKTRAHEQAQSPLEQLDEVRELVASTLKRVRDLSLNLRPAILDDLGLLPALQWHFERYTQQTGVQVDFDQSELDRRFPAEIETGAYRLIQEALTNVARHAAVREVTVRCIASEKSLKLYVVDDGVGFDAEEAIAAGLSSGLASMRERATLLGGAFLPSSAPGAGTTIEVELPLPREDTTTEDKWTSDRDAARDLARDISRDALRDAGRDSARDIARDSTRDAGRDAGRDRERDTARDIARDIPRDVARDVARDDARDVARDEARGMVHEQQRKHSANGRQTPEPKDPQP